MQQLLGDRLGTAADANSFLRELFMQRLPAPVRMVLASADPTTELGKLAEMADKVTEVATPTIAAVAENHPKSPRQQQPPCSEVQQLREDVARLTSLVESLATQPHRRSLSKHRRRSPSPAAPTNQPSESLCWYHRKFGQDAQKCKEPCTWTLNPQAGN